MWWDWNNSIFSRQTVIDRELLSQVKFIANNCYQQGEVVGHQGKQRVLVRWDPPPPGFYKINVNALHYRSSGIKVLLVGGLVRSCRWWKVCPRTASTARWVRAMLLGRNYGLYVCGDSIGYTSGVASSSYLNLRWTLKSLSRWCKPIQLQLSFFNRFCMRLLLYILQQPDWRTSIVQVYREANRYMDFLANMGHSGDFTWVLVDKVPSG